MRGLKPGVTESACRFTESDCPDRAAADVLKAHRFFREIRGVTDFIAALLVIIWAMSGHPTLRHCLSPHVEFLITWAVIFVLLLAFWSGAYWVYLSLLEVQP